MAWDVFIKSITIARENGISTVNFFGGEPFLNPQVLSMLQETLESGLSLMLATNCRPLSDKRFFNEFYKISEPYKERIVIYTARDKFHLKFFDPISVVDDLRSKNYSVFIQDYSNQVVAISECNAKNTELQKLNKGFSCCAASPKDHLGVLPDGGWTICPPSLEPFGSIFSNTLPQIVEFKRALPMRFKEGCTECLKDFKHFSERFRLRLLD